MCGQNTYSLGQSCTPCAKGSTSHAGAASCAPEALMQLESKEAKTNALFARLGSRLRGFHR